MKLKHNCNIDSKIVKRQLKFFAYKLNKSKKNSQKIAYIRLIKDFKTLLYKINVNKNNRNYVKQVIGP